VAQDPQGRFSYQAASELKPQPTDGTYDYYLLDSPAMEVYVVAAEAPSEQAAEALTFERIGKDFDALKFRGRTSLGGWKADRFSTAVEGKWAGIAFQYRESTLYGLVVFGGSDSNADLLPASVTGIIGSFRFGPAAGEVFYPKNLADLEGYIDRTAAAFKGSLSVAALKDGKVVYSYAAGDRGGGLPVSPEVAWQWGSASKIVTAAAVMQQVEQGRVDLDDSLDVYFPEFPLGSRIKVRNLLTHSAGLPDLEYRHYVAFGDNPMPDLASVLADYWPRVDGLVYEPGLRSMYHNWSFLVLARLVEKASGQEFTSYVRRHILEPAGMQHTSYTTAGLAGAPEALAVVTAERLAVTEAALAAGGLNMEGFVAYRSYAVAYLQPYDILPGWAGLKGTAEDAARFGWLFLNDGQIAGRSILNKATVRAMQSMQKSTYGKPLGFGLAWYLERQGRESIVEHAGGGPGIDAGQAGHGVLRADF
jgi:CubicO group peptidase (beta-lactamase class C family)